MNSENKKITGRKLSLFCLDDAYERHYLVTLNQEITDQGMMFTPILSLESEEAYGFETVEMATKYMNFLYENIKRDFFYCILPENKLEEEIINEDEKVVDKDS